MSIPQDAGLRAVARVRGVREQDSRLGLRQAIAVTARREAEAEQARQLLDGAPAFEQGSSAQFQARRTALAAMAAQVRRTREAAAASRSTTDEARRRWQHDRTRLRAVESLLERRAGARRVEANRRESHELDDIASRLWLRRHSSRRSGPHVTVPGGGDAA